ncbi:MAG: tyrosine-type recombinase/integrase [Clostridia bacterium]|nr:tyrosine-type recombinase/integrase [Clostridia bacterium]
MSCWEDPTNVCGGERTWPTKTRRRCGRRKAGLEGVNLHALRHTYATRLLELGEDLKVVQELLGHARIAITADLYAHVSPKLKRDAVAKLNGTLTAKKKPSA